MNSIISSPDDAPDPRVSLLVLSRPVFLLGLAFALAGHIATAQTTIGNTTITSSSVLNVPAAGVNSTGTLTINANGSSGYNAVTGTGTLNLRNGSSSASIPDIKLDDTDVANTTTNYGSVIATAMDLGSVQRFIWGKTNHNSVSNYLASTGADTNFTGAISGSGGLTFIAQQSYTGTNPMEVPFVLSGNNSFTGLLEIQRGSVYLNNANALNKGNILKFSPATTTNARFFLFGNNASVSDLQSTGAGTALIANGNVTNLAGSSATNAATLTVNEQNDTNYGGTIVNSLAEYDRASGSASGALSLYKTGNANLTLTGADTYTGGTTLSAGQLSLGNNTALGSGLVTVNDASTGLSNTALSLASAVKIANAVTVANLGSGTVTLLATGAAQTEFSGALTLNRDITVNSSNNAYAYSATQNSNGGLQFKGAITGAGGITFTGGNLILLYNGANAYSGITTVTANTKLALYNAVSASANSIYQLDAGSVVSMAGLTAASFGGLTGSGTLNGETGWGPTYPTSYLQVGAKNAPSNDFSGSITGAVELSKVGTGTQILSGTSNYTGSAKVLAGTLVVSGSISGNATTVGDSANLSTSATLRGTGTVGPLTLGAAASNTGAVIDPGTAASTTGKLNVAGIFQAQAGAHLSLQLGGLTPGSAVSGYDQLSSTGAMSLGGATLDISFLNGFEANLTAGTTFDILLNGSSSAITGTFSGTPVRTGVFGSLLEGDVFNVNSTPFSISYLANADAGPLGNDVRLTVAPEPASSALLLSAATALAGLTRRRRALQ